MIKSGLIVCLNLLKGNVAEINNKLPGHIRVVDNSHSTATDMEIILLKGDEKLQIWRSRIWTSSSYQFNDKGLTFGTQPGCDFAKDLIDHVFEVASAVVEENKRQYINEQNRKAAEKEVEETNKINGFKDFLDSKSNQG